MKPEHLKLESTSGAQINMEALYQICPSCFTETKDEKTGELRRTVNFTTLRQLLGDDTVEDAPEAYEFNWVGKQEARREVARPINKTLRPVKEDSVDWDNTENLYIEGDNLEALKLLQKSYLGKVKMIYIDPPYNTGNDFVYDDDFATSQSDDDLAAGNVDELGNRFRKNTDSNGRFHSDWCSMIYSRLLMARTLLTEDGVIFISIDDNEVENLRKVCDEVLGENNYLATFKWNRVAKAPSLSGMVRTKYEYVLTYFRSIQPKLFGKASYNTQGPLWHLPNKRSELVFPARSIRVNQTFLKGNYGGTYQVELLDDLIEENGLNKLELRIKACSAWGQQKISDYVCRGKTFQIKKNPTTMYTDLDSEDNYIAPSDLISDEECGVKRNTDAKEELRRMGIPFDYSKPQSLPQYLIKTVTYNHKDATILDFFSGSATTAHAVMQLNAEDGGKRKFIMVQLPEKTDEKSEAYKAGYKNICEIGKERIRRAGKKIKEESPLTTQDLDTGFRVFRVDDSNMKEVYYAPKEYNQGNLDLYLDDVKADRTDLDLLFGCMLDWGVRLSLPMKQEKVGDCIIYTVNDGDLVACFSKEITKDVVKAIADKSPLKVIFRDSCFAQDDAKINIYESFKQLLNWSDDEVFRNIKVI
jgi:adenine-specific DNA-methyltransferase